MSGKTIAVVPIYNCSFSIVSRAIRSLINQTCENLRIIIIDDCSKENIFSQLNDEFENYSNITLIRNETNIGFANTLNKVLKLVMDEQYLFVLEHDCELLNSDYIALAINNLGNTGIGAVCGENVLPPVDEMTRIKRIFVSHLNEDVHDSTIQKVGFLLLKADAFRVSVLQEVGGFQSAGQWKFACEEHIISYKIRSHGYSIIKDPKLQFRGYWGGQDSLQQNLRKEALYGRGLGCAYAGKKSDLNTGKSFQLKAKKMSRLLQLQYVFLTVLSIPLLFFNALLAVFLLTTSFLIYFAYLVRGSLVLAKDKFLFIVTGYLRAWVYIPNFCLGLIYGLYTQKLGKSKYDTIEEA